MKKRKEKMEIIKDSYNKTTECFHCGSTFSYNEKDTELVYPSTDYNEKYTNMLKKAKDFSYISYSKGKAVRCPLCNTILLVEAVKFFGRN